MIYILFDVGAYLLVLWPVDNWINIWIHMLPDQAEAFRAMHPLPIHMMWLTQAASFGVAQVLLSGHTWPGPLFLIRYFAPLYTLNSSVMLLYFSTTHAYRCKDPRAMSYNVV